jgi:hypothetical protein
LLHHDRLFADILDLFYHVQLFFNITFVGLKGDGYLSVCGVSSPVRTTGNVCDFSKLGPASALIDLRAAGVDALGDFNLFGFDDVVLLIFFDDFFERYNHFAIDQSHFNLRLLLSIRILIVLIEIIQIIAKRSCLAIQKDIL